MKSKKKIKLGKKGEKLAQKYLKENNYQIIEINYRNSLGEIDIIAKHDDIFCFIEVKTKTGSYFGLPEEMVNKQKINKIINLVKKYFFDQAISFEQENFQIDIISVMIKPDQKYLLNHIHNITSYE